MKLTEVICPSFPPVGGIGAAFHYHPDHAFGEESDKVSRAVSLSDTHSHTHSHSFRYTHTRANMRTRSCKYIDAHTHSRTRTAVLKRNVRGWLISAWLGEFRHDGCHASNTNAAFIPVYLAGQSC